MPLTQVLDEKGQLVGPEPKLDPQLLRRMYRTMVLQRELDEAGMRLQRQGRLGFYGTCTGEEAAAVGAAAAVRDTDWAFPALRQGAVLLWRGWSLDRWFGHLFGNKASVEQGRSMACHYSDRDVNVVAWSSCMATQLPHAVGMSYAARLKRRDDIALAFMGDGATSENDFHMAMNFAGVWRAPTVFVCNNNQWAISVPFEKQTASDGIAIKARAYGFPGIRVDGNDVLAVYRTVREAAARARAGEGPTLIEAVTYRVGAHSSSDDPSKYRDEAEVEAWKARDPIERFRTYLLERAVLVESQDTEWREQLREEIKEAIRTAEQAGAPDLETLVTDVYQDVPWHLQQQLDDVRRFQE